MKKDKKNKKDKDIKLLQNYRMAFRMMRQIYPEKFVINLILTVFNSVISFFTYTYILSYVVNGLQLGKPISALITYVLCMMVLQIAISSVNIVCRNYVFPIIDKKSERRISYMINKKSVESDISNYEDPNMYALYGRAISVGAGSIEYVMWQIINIVSMILNLGLSSFLVLTIDPVLFVFTLIPLSVNFLRKKTSKSKRDFDVDAAEINRKREYTRRVFYQSEYAKEMRLTNIYEVMLRRFRESIKEYMHLLRTKGVRVALLYFFSSAVTEIFAVAAAEIYTIYRLLVSGTVMIGDCLVVLNTISSISHVLNAVGGQISWIQYTCYAFQDFRDFMWRDEKIESCKNDVKASPGDIELRGVTFRYQGAEGDTIRGIDLTMRRGEKIAVVGYNGAGKTTLVKLLMRLYDPSSGEILMDGRDIREYDIDSYRDCFGIVFQDYKQVALSVAENVLGRPMEEGDEKLVEDSLRRAGLWDKISALPDGIYTRMTKEFDGDGLILSGGESQKLAIASVYARECGIVILDEPSSALDPLAEHEMYRQMYSACEGKTMIFISHRLSSATDADRIILMEDGAIKETGSHAELMRLNGSYAEMFRAQAESYA